MILNLDKDVTPEKLVKAGFRSRSDNKRFYTLREYLYKDTISLSVTIDFAKDEDEQLEWYVIDSNTGTTYNTFYFTPNTCRDLVREEVIRSFNEIIGELSKRKILYIVEVIMQRVGMFHKVSFEQFKKDMTKTLEICLQRMFF